MIRSWIAGVVALSAIYSAIPAAQADSMKATKKVVKAKGGKRVIRKQVRQIYPKLLTSRQIAAMSPAQRANYLKQVRLALVEFEKMQMKSAKALSRTSIAGDFISDMIAQINLLEAANAGVEEEPAAGGTTAPPGLPFIFDLGGGKYRLGCAAPYTLDHVMNVCYVANPASAQDCKGMMAYKVLGGNQPTQRCIPAQVYDQLAQAKRDNTYLWSTGVQVMNNTPGLDGKPVIFNDANSAAIAIDRQQLYDKATLESILATTSAPVKKTWGEQVRLSEDIRRPWQPEVKVLGPSAAALNNDHNLDVIKALTATLGDRDVTQVMGPDGKFTCSNNEKGEYKFDAKIGACASATYRPCNAGEGVQVRVPGTTDERCVPKQAFLAMSDGRMALVCPKNGRSTSGEQLTCTPSSMLTDIAGTTEEDQKAAFGGAERVLPDPTKDILGRPIAPAAVNGDVQVEPLEPAGGTCEWKPLTCAPSPASDKALRRAFRKAHDENTAFVNQALSVCVFAGNFSIYKDHKAESGQCLPPVGIEETNIKCDAGKVLCNPLVFGLKGGAGICVPAKGQSTQNCAENVATPFESVDFASSPSWDILATKFEAAFKAYCLAAAGETFESKFKDYFCNECNTIGKTIIDANKEFARKMNLCEAPPAKDTNADGALAQPSSVYSGTGGDDEGGAVNEQDGGGQNCPAPHCNGVEDKNGGDCDCRG